MSKRVFLRNPSYENMFRPAHWFMFLQFELILIRNVFALGLVLKQGPNGNGLMIVIVGFMHQYGSNHGQKPQRTMPAELLKINSSLHSLLGQYFEFHVPAVDFGCTGQHRKPHPPGTSNGGVPLGPRPVQDGDYSCGYGL